MSYIGNKKMNDVFVGNNKVSKIYIGNTLVYQEQVTPIVEYFLTFSSPSSFTLRVTGNTKYWDGTMEYSTDKTTWQTWSGTSAISSSNTGKLYLRGIGNTKVGSTNNNSAWVFTSSNNDSIRCNGDIENLLDYATVELGNHPAMATYCFAKLFRMCSNLKNTPTIDYREQFRSLPSYSFYATFNGCSSLEDISFYPRSNSSLRIGDSSFAYMFYNCISLNKLPRINANNGGNTGLGYMFNGCSNIKISATQTGEYIKAYKIFIGSNPESNALVDMFANTGGTFTGTPTNNTTYYTSNEVIE